MARLLAPDPGDRLVYIPAGVNLRLAPGATAVVYADDSGTTLADIAAFQPDDPSVPGPTVPGSRLTVDPYSLMPFFWLPDGGESAWVRVNAGPLVQVFPAGGSGSMGFGSAGNKTLTGSPPASQQIAAVATTYHGFSLKEITALSPAVIVLWDNPTGASGQILDTVTLAPNESRAEWYGDGGVAADSGIWVQVVSGSVSGSVRYGG